MLPSTVPLMLVLFDLDGTLTDPYVGITRSVAHALDRLSAPPLSEQQLRAFIGPPLQDSFASLGLDSGTVARAIGLYRERFSEQGLYENEVYAGIPDALDALVASGTRMAVATSKPTTFAERILDHFNLSKYFAAVAGATLDGSRRNKADIIAFALTQLDTEPREARMVGDRAQDVIGAQHHQMLSVGVRWGYAEAGELEGAGADVIVSTPEQLVRVLAEDHSHEL